MSEINTNADIPESIVPESVADVVADNGTSDDSAVLTPVSTDPEQSEDYEKYNSISRYKKREQTFLLVFEGLFSQTAPDEIALCYTEASDRCYSEYAVNTATEIEKNKEEIDNVISAHLASGWKLSRISRVSLALLKVAVYEILFDDTIPISVSINEAVELAKRYSVQEDAAFVNGVLGAVSREFE